MDRKFVKCNQNGCDLSHPTEYCLCLLNKFRDDERYLYSGLTKTQLKKHREEIKDTLKWKYKPYWRDLQKLLKNNSVVGIGYEGTYYD